MIDINKPMTAEDGGVVRIIMDRPLFRRGAGSAVVYAAVVATPTREVAGNLYPGAGKFSAHGMMLSVRNAVKLEDII